MTLTTCSLALFNVCSFGCPLDGFGLAKNGSQVMLEMGDALLSMEEGCWRVMMFGGEESAGGGEIGMMGMGGVGSGVDLLYGLWIRSYVAIFT